MNRKIWLAWVMIALIVLTGWWYTKDEAQISKVEHVTIGHAPGQFSVLFPIFVGQKTEIFAKHNLEVSGQELDTKVGVPALIGGSVDYLPFSREGAAAALKGGDVKFVTLITENQFQHFIGRPLSTNTLKIGVSHLYSATHYLTLLAIERNGYEAEIIDAGNSFPAAISLLKRGEIDAAVLGYFGPTNFAGDGIVILDDFGATGLITGLSTLEKTIEEKPEQVQKVAQAFMEIASFIKDNPEATKEFLFEYYKFTDRSEAEVNKVEAAYAGASQYLSTTGLPTLEQQKLLVQTAKVSEFQSLDDIRQTEVSEEDLAIVFDLRFVK